MTIQVMHTAIRDVKLIAPLISSDGSGVFFESFDQSEFEEKIIRGYTFVQDHHWVSARHVLRGMHYQLQRPQGKLVRVVVGEIFYAAIDLRRWSPTFGRWIGARLSASNCQQLWIPPGFAHGWVVLSDVAELLCKTTERSHPEHERTLLWNDPDIGVAWELDEPPIVSRNDAAGVSFSMSEIY
ncbi:dTDP-4-dehydrorhamnose 3,5-epimerase [Paraburkholderia lacunae]|uniref:dTDP-4-dehydrorhamnose 3,5-epimerase n=1 Tax=Paraburkholderia lacunae TaxID=2211104 RepID=A0A370N590_9BURK|nr:dTDP-4-dehydrorhamnose 3,5-epimerase [Paraburkholderia lacunae]RDK00793.1 dTDP-4-dehydrorhamnose 3,5-epimerase [Paraburkholderia lacunae]